MKTNKYLSLMMVILISTLLFSCSESAPEGLTLIPEDTKYVTVVNVASIFQKAKFKELQEMKSVKLLEKELKNENQQLSKIFKSLMKSPGSSGVDFSKEIFMFFTAEAKDESFVCFSMDLSDGEAFRDFLEKMYDATNTDFNIESEDNFQYAMMSNEALASWSDHKALFLIASNYSSRENLDIQAEILMELKEDKTILSNLAFKDFFEEKKDLSMWLSMDLLEALEGRRAAQEVEKQIGFEISGNYLTAHLNFNDNDITLDTKVTTNDELAAFLSENNIWRNDYNKEILNFLPAQNHAAIGVSVDTRTIIDYINERAEMEQVNQESESKLDLSLDEIVNSFGGSIAFSVSDFRKVKYTYQSYGSTYNPEKYRRYNSYTGKYYYDGGYDYGQIEKEKEELLPIMGLTAGINSDLFIRKIIEKVPEDLLVPTRNYYSFKLDNQYPAYLAFNEKAILITNDKKSVRVFSDGGMTNNLSNTDCGREISESMMYAAAGLDLSNYGEELENSILTNNSSDQEKIYNSWNKMMEKIELKQREVNSFNLTLKFKKSDENSLKTILDMLDQNFKSFAAL